MTRRQRNSAGGERDPTETENFLRAMELALLGTDEVLWLSTGYLPDYAAAFCSSKARVRVLALVA